MTEYPLQTRAVERAVPSNCEEVCQFCDKEIVYDIMHRTYRVLCNIYENYKWNRLECFHPECYEIAEKPYGDIIDKKVKTERVKKR